MNNKIFLESEELSFNRKLAKIISVEGAIVLNYIHNCIQENKKNGINYIEGKYWVVKSLKDWQNDVFNFWNQSTVKRTFSALEKNGVLVACKLTKRDFDHTKWYTIDYDELENMI